MDFWDLCKTLWRRSWVTGPLLLLTAAAGTFVWSQAQPDFRAVGHVSLMAPTVREPTVANPWNPETMAGILVVRLQDNADIERILQTDGFTGRYVVSVETSRDQPLPIVRFEVTARDPRTARAMVVRLIEIAATAVAAQQQPANLPANEQISLIALSSGENVVEVNTTTIRAVVVVVLAGLILTIGAAVGVDALARNRMARRTDDGPIPANPVAPRHRGPGPEPSPSPMPTPGRSPLASSVGPRGERTHERTHERTRERPYAWPEPGGVASSDSTIRIPTAARSGPGGRSPALASRNAVTSADAVDDIVVAADAVDEDEQWFDLTEGAVAAGGGRAAKPAREPERDVTIVLPLSSRSMRSRVVDAVERVDDRERGAPEHKNQ